MYLTNDLMNWTDWLNEICILRVTDIRWSYQNLLFWTGIVWHRLSANQIVRCFKLKKLNYMRYQVDFLLPLKVQKISYYFRLCWKILLVNQFAGFFTFDLFDLLILIPLLHCTCFFGMLQDFKKGVQTILTNIHCNVQQFLHNCNFSKYFPMIMCNKNMTAKVCTIFSKKPIANVKLSFVAKEHHFIAWKSWNHIFDTSFKTKGLQVMDIKAFTKLPLLYFWRKKRMREIFNRTFLNSF